MKAKINNRQITFAREYRGYSQTDLAAQIEGLSQSNLSKFEKGIGQISDEVFQKIITFLKFPEKFYYEIISNNAENAHYRKRALLSKKDISKIEYSTKLIGYLLDQFAFSLEFPEFNIKPIDVEEGYQPDIVARFVRKSLGLKDEPIKDIFSLLERNGIVVVEFDAETDEFDGVSFETDKGYPVIIVNKSLSNDRKRFTLAHELGHLVLHSTFLVPEYRDKEKEANQFASEFLMPALAIRNSLMHLKMSYLADLKRYWLTSMVSIIRRAKDLECITMDRYRFFNIEISRYGYKKKEPVNVYIDEPKLFWKAYQMHKLELGYNDNEIADAFNLPIDIIKRFFGSGDPVPKLRIVA